jgi:hypothetical protein
MNVLLRDLLALFGIVEAIYERIRKLLIPPKAFSWQTLIYLSLFSWVMSFLCTGLVREIITFLGWVFLIAGTAWYTTDNPLVIPGTNIPIGAVITGFLVSVFAFAREEDVLTPRTIILWPTITALITALPEFIEGTGTDAKAQIPSIEKRQKMIILIGSGLVISCWLQFYFVVDNWLNEYPSIRVDNFENSAFVVRTQFPDRVPKNGIIILDELTPLVEEKLSGTAWSEVEKLLLSTEIQWISNLGRQVINTNLAEYEEKFLWRVEPRIDNLKSGYTLDLLSIWTGPSSRSGGYYLRKSCRIDPVIASGNTVIRTNQTEDDKNIVAEIECDPEAKFIQQAPPKQPGRTTNNQ